MADLIEVKKSAIESVTLRLTGDEAATLRAILRRVGGSCTSRTLLDNIAAELDRAGVTPKCDLIDPKLDAIYFLPTP